MKKPGKAAVPLCSFCVGLGDTNYSKFFQASAEHLKSVESS